MRGVKEKSSKKRLLNAPSRREAENAKVKKRRLVETCPRLPSPFLPFAFLGFLVPLARAPHPPGTYDGSGGNGRPGTHRRSAPWRARRSGCSGKLAPR